MRLYVMQADGLCKLERKYGGQVLSTVGWAFRSRASHILVFLSSLCPFSP